MYTFPTQYAPVIILLLKKHIAYLTYTMCSEYHNTTKVAYCVPYTICSNYHSTTEVAYFVLYLHNMLPLSRYYKGSILCALSTQYARNIILRGGSICNENPFITPSTKALGFNVICQRKDQNVAVKMVHETLFYLCKFNKLQTF